MRWKVALLSLVGLYVVFLGVTYAAMRQPPERFARYMSALPAPAQRLVPFPPMWNYARAGRLSVGDAVPDFTLDTQDRSARVTLSTYRAGRPAVLIFGSFT